MHISKESEKVNFKILGPVRNYENNNLEIIILKNQNLEKFYLV